MALTLQMEKAVSKKAAASLLFPAFFSSVSPGIHSTHVHAVPD